MNEAVKDALCEVVVLALVVLGGMAGLWTVGKLAGKVFGRFLNRPYGRDGLPHQRRWSLVRNDGDGGAVRRCGRRHIQEGVTLCIFGRSRRTAGGALR